jgi:hypothetical protein
MFADNSSTTKAPGPEAEYTLHDERSRPPAEHLREIAHRHQLCYEVWPEWSVAEERKIQIGFELQLCGTNTHDSGDGSDHPVPGCSHCFSTYGELREIAESILPPEGRPSRYEIGAFDRSLHIAPPKRRRRNEVIVSIHITHRHDFNRAVDDCEDRCLKEIRQSLHALGIVEGTWHEPADGQVEEGRKVTK